MKESLTAIQDYEKTLSKHLLARLAERVHSTMDAVHKALSRIRIKLQACIERRLQAEGG